MGDSSFYVSFSDTRWYPQATSISAICLIEEIGQNGACTKTTVMAVSVTRKGGFLEVHINGFGIGLRWFNV